MSRQEDGFGRKVGPNPGSQSDFTNRPSISGAPGTRSWGSNALNAQSSEVGLMTQGAGRPDRPATGQRPMFGGGSPVFAQMPSYTPVSRGPDPRPQSPEPPAYTPYAAAQQRPAQPIPSQPAQQSAPGLSYPSPHAPSPLNYPSSFAEPAPSYESPQPGAAPSYQTSPYAAPGYNAGPNYQTAEFGGQAYQQPRPSSFSGSEHPGSQSYQASSYDSAQGFQGQSYRDQSFADASFPESGAGDASFPETGFDQSFADTNYANQNFAKPGFADAGFPQHQGFDASFPEQVFPSGQPHGHHDRPAHDNYAQPEDDHDQGFEPFHDEPAQDYGNQVPKMDPRRQLQAFDAIYDQPPQIALGSTEPPRRQATQDFYEGERLDADFLDEASILPPPGAAPAKTGLTLRSRSAFMVGSALLGAIALGGALAFAYKQSGGGLGSEPPPLVQADNSPVKEVPDQPGGKEFPHKNKLIYDRLQNADEPEAEKLVPRQEEIAVPALPGADPAAMPAPVASTDAVPPTTQALPGAESIPIAAVDDPSMPDGGPRKVKTMVVRPDGSVETAPVPAGPEAAPAEAAAPAAADAQLAAAPTQPQPQEVPALPQEVAAPAPLAPAPAPEAKPEPKPKPAAKPAAQQTAAATPKAAAGPSKYVVQVGSKKNQTEALASFADMQQKYPTLLASYRPIVQKADLGTKGTWYRLRIGPISDKTAANKLCSQLKSQGLPDCLVMGQ